MTGPAETTMLSLTGAVSYDAPFRWHHTPGVFPAGTLAELQRSFPEDGFADTSSTRRDKSYTMRVRRLHPAVAGERDRTPPPWQRFTEYVTGAAYRRDLAALTGVPLERARVEVNLWRYGRGCWLDPHVDKPEKLVTHVLYLTPHWPAGQGGDLLLLGSPSEDDVVHRVPPLGGSGVVLVRSERSWHAVARVRGDAGPGDGHGDRLSAQVVFHTA